MRADATEWPARFCRDPEGEPLVAIREKIQRRLRNEEFWGIGDRDGTWADILDDLY